MASITLTDFIDIVSKSGTPKATKVRQVKNREPYTPAADFYKRIREGIIDVHRNGRERGDLDGICAGLSAQRTRHCSENVAAYKRWWGRKQIQWFDPPSEVFSAHGVDVSVRPELGLVIDGSAHLVKLYFNTEPLRRNRADIITCLMDLAISMEDDVPEGTAMCVLDVRRRNLMLPHNSVDLLPDMLDAELAYIAALWDAV